MKILGIETSCDETAAAVVESGTKIISNVVASSAKFHATTGGIIPEMAARQQIKSIIPVIQKALDESRLKIDEIDSIAVTYGPGLIGSLLVGVETAKTLAYVWNKPIVPVNHLVAHIYANFLVDTRKSPQFPALALVVSGGHTDLVLMKDYGLMKLIGSTRDDAAGEAFDKCARLLGLHYPGGPSISKASEKYLRENPNKKLKLFPRPLIGENTLEWSFSGLKTAVLRETKKEKFNVEEFAAEIQEAIVDVLINKTLKGVHEYKPKSLLLSGGVAANLRLREKIERESQKLDVKLFIPDAKLCTDNGAVIASAAYFMSKGQLYNNPLPWQKVNANPELTITS